MNDFYTYFEDFISKKGYTFYSLENELNIGGGTFTRSKKAGSVPSPKTMTKIIAKFPDFNYQPNYNENVVQEKSALYVKSEKYSNLIDILADQLKIKDEQISSLHAIIHHLTLSNT